YERQRNERDLEERADLVEQRPHNGLDVAGAREVGRNAPQARKLALLEPPARLRGRIGAAGGRADGEADEEPEREPAPQEAHAAPTPPSGGLSQFEAIVALLW